jgi:hypothetical protein
LGFTGAAAPVRRGSVQQNTSQHAAVAAVILQFQ